MDLQPISGITDELNSEFQQLEGEYGLGEGSVGDESMQSEHEPFTDDQGQPIDLDKSVEDQKEVEAIDKLYSSPCCSLGPKKSACWSQFNRKAVVRAHRKTLELGKDELDLVILANIQAGRASSDLFSTDEDSPGTSKRVAIQYNFGGRRICKTMFSFVCGGIGHSRLENLIKHYSTDGIATRVHKLSRKRPHNLTSFEVTTNVKEYIEKFADNHALPLPGRLPAFKDYRVMLLPSDMTKMFVFSQYVKTCQQEQFSDGIMSRWTFQRIWNETCPYIAVMKPATDLCFDCQQNPSLLMRAANMSEAIKSQRLEDAQRHLSLARKQRHHYNEQCKFAKQLLDTSELSPPYMHYSFDFAQQIHFPYSSQQPGQLFFRTPRKCGIFGVACEATSSQVNYLIDGADSIGKGANTIISLVHNYLEYHGHKEANLMLHADNCIGQNKNNAFMQYISWRVFTKRNRTVHISFMLSGHTKFAPD